MLAHNGEINTIEGNRRWAQARSKVWKTPRFDIAEFDPVISMHGSDSQSLDNMLELMVAGGMELIQALRILVPPATQSLEFKDAGPGRVLRVPRPQQRAVGWPGRHRRLRQPLCGVHAGPQRPAPGALDADRRPPLPGRLRSRRGKCRPSAWCARASSAPAR
jgi:hypothetical protein